jgi:hypothetical protein
MAGGMSPRELADELRLHPSTVRAWLRRQGLRPDGGRWLLGPDVAAQVRTYYTDEARARVGERGVCVVDGCDRPLHVRAGWCQMHWQRWRRTGSLERVAPGQNNSTKTHCPRGHPYAPDNVYVFADGRRRCRRCRIRAVRRSRRRAVENAG